jgi:hypothetical protein
MRPEDVPDCWVWKAWDAFDGDIPPNRDNTPTEAMRAAIAAVAPAIAAQERKACAAACQEIAAVQTALAGVAQQNGDTEMERLHRISAADYRLAAAVIRARGEAGDA